MIELLTLLWRFFEAQPQARFLAITPWHLLAVLAVLAVLAALGLHYAVGHVLRFYRRRSRVRAWIALPTLVLWLVSVPALVVVYVLALQAGPLVDRNIREPDPNALRDRMGALLLEPVFALPPLAGNDPAAVPKEHLIAALDGVREHEYRQALQAHVMPPLEMSPAGAGGASAEDIMVQFGLRWVINPEAALPALGTAVGPAAEGLSRDEEDGGFYLGRFLTLLVDEVQPGIVLTRGDWEHIAGTNYVDRVLRPVMTEYVRYSAAAMAAALLLLDALYFLLMWRLKRVGMKKKPAVPAAPPEEAVDEEADRAAAAAIREAHGEATAGGTPAPVQADEEPGDGARPAPEPVWGGPAATEGERAPGEVRPASDAEHDTAEESWRGEGAEDEAAEGEAPAAPPAPAAEEPEPPSRRGWRFWRH